LKDAQGSNSETEISRPSALFYGPLPTNTEGFEPYFDIVDDLHTSNDRSMSFLPPSSVYQRNEHKIPGLSRVGEKMTSY
jgi:hypothetical protein